jgi:beta-galactosidase/beta-glucuronidase
MPERRGKMEYKKFSGILMIISGRLLQVIENERNVGIKEAADLLYNSNLYEMLEIEESKLWHLSIPTLYNLLNEELTTGKITYPQEV